MTLTGTWIATLIFLHVAIIYVSSIFVFFIRQLWSWCTHRRCGILCWGWECSWPRSNKSRNIGLSGRAKNRYASSASQYKYVEMYSESQTISAWANCKVEVCVVGTSDNLKPHNLGDVKLWGENGKIVYLYKINMLCWEIKKVPEFLKKKYKNSLSKISL